MRMQINPKAPIACCPHCGSDAGFYSKDYLKGKIQYHYSFDGRETYNGEMYDYLEHEQGVYAYCENCGRRLFKMSELED